MNPPILPDRETRRLTGSLELRTATDTERPRVRGYAAKFNVESENLGNSDYQFREVIAPGAFDNVMNDDVRALFNHDPNMVLARSKNGEGTLALGSDSTGLWYEFEAPDTQAGRDLIENIRLGNVDQSSFGFSVARGGDKWSRSMDGEAPGFPMRTITRVSRLFDVSPVTYPAYPDATVALRSLETFQADSPPTITPEPEAIVPPTPEQLSEAGDWAARIGLPD